MSDYDDNSDYETSSNNVSSFEFSEDDEDNALVNDNHSFIYDHVADEDNYKVMYTYPTSKTSSGKPTHRMKYQTLNYDDIQSSLSDIVKRLSAILNLDFDTTLILLLKYEWKEDKLLDSYVNTKDTDEFFKSFGLKKKDSEQKEFENVTSETDPDLLCGVCYCGPSEDEPMDFFAISACGHKFCVECYTHYLKNKNMDSNIFIECPYADPKCNQLVLLSEIQKLSDYNQTIITPGDETVNKSRLITEDEIKEMYNLSDPDDNSDDMIVFNQPSHLGNDEEQMYRQIYEYQKENQRREQEEREAKLDKSLVYKYWSNINRQYCIINSKRYKHCPYPDCGSVVEFLGFDSDTIASIEELKQHLLVPLVRCADNHQFCFGCKELPHSPCPCIAVNKWIQICNDDTETLHWMEKNTKDCPRCKTLIEKNGGCNHMSCSSCHFQFCWICLGDWNAHLQCNRYVATNSKGKNESRLRLSRYLFYFEVFNNQRVSYEKDRDLLSKFEVKIKELEPTTGESWIETSFYKECVSVLLEGRLALQWSYAFLYFVPTCHGKQLIEAAQWQLSNKVEELSKLFQIVSMANVMKKKPSFLKTKSQLISAHTKFLETCMDTFSDKGITKQIKASLNVT